MIQLLKRLISYKNLTKINNPKGQISTLMILMLTLMLMFVLVTVNIGNVGIVTTTMSNASDQAVLQLASSLTTKGHQLYVGLGNKYKKCKATGFLGIILAVVFAVIVAVVIIVFTVGTTTPGVIALAIVLGAAAGAAGGALGNAISGADPAQGALMGAQIGAAIGASVAGGYGAVAAGTIFSAAGGLAVLGVLSIGAFAFNQVVAYNDFSGVLSQLQKMFSKLSERDRYREAAFFTALSQVLDDPNKEQDMDDANGNGLTTDLVSSFVARWYKRILTFVQLTTMNQSGAMNAFLAAMKEFDNAAKTATTGGKDGEIGSLEREDYLITADVKTETVTVQGSPPARDGAIVSVLRFLYNYGYVLPSYTINLGPPPASVSLPMWQPGPSAGAMQNWINVLNGDDQQEECVPGDACYVIPPGYDDLDKMSDDLQDMVLFMDTILAQYKNNSADSSMGSWEEWMPFFYDLGDPEDPSAYYFKLNSYMNFLQQLEEEIVRIRDTHFQYPTCSAGQYDAATGICGACAPSSGELVCGTINGIEVCWWVPTDPSACGDCVTNPPCIDPATGEVNGGGHGDFFQPAIDAIERLIGEMAVFRDAMVAFANSVQIDQTELESQVGIGGINPIRYDWNDSRGHHYVEVEAGPFKIPKLKKSSSFFKTCIKLKNYREDGTNCWIRIRRSDPSQFMGFLGEWNPFNARIAKKSSAYFDIGKVGLARTW